MIYLESSLQKCTLCASSAVVSQLKSVNLYHSPDGSLERDTNFHWVKNYCTKALSVIPANQVALEMYIHAFLLHDTLDINCFIHCSPNMYLLKKALKYD